MNANGADALRMALISYTQQTRQINLDGQAVVSAAHFGNKLWNFASYTIARVKEIEGDIKRPLPQDPTSLSFHDLSRMDLYILSRMAHVVDRTNKAFREMRLHDSTTAIRRVIVEDLCDVYVEYSKPILYGRDPDGKVGKGRGIGRGSKLILTFPLPSIRHGLFFAFKPILHSNLGKGHCRFWEYAWRPPCAFSTLLCLLSPR